jgi:hypothetical protein
MAKRGAHLRGHVDVAPGFDARFNVDEVRAILVSAAKAGHVLTYADCLNALGMGFSRPKMRALCKVLDVIDQRGAMEGEPALAVLVVRQSDGVPGQGWWVGRDTGDYNGPWEGPEALGYIQPLQQRTFSYWSTT